MIEIKDRNQRQNMLFQALNKKGHVMAQVWAPSENAANIMLKRILFGQEIKEVLRVR